MRRILARTALLATVLTGLVQEPATAASPRDKAEAWNPPRIIPLADSESLPDPAELEARDARIGEILVRVEDVFDLDNPSENNRLYRAANALHYKTRKATIVDQLTFRSGDPLVAQRLAESERILRGRRYLYDAVIRIARYDPSRNVADLEIVVQDVWTLDPGVSFSNTGGQERTQFQVEELNLLGTGQKLQLAYESNVDRTSTEIEWINPNVLGSRWAVATRYADLSDGQSSYVGVERPFYSLDTRWSVGLTALEDQRTYYRYDLGRPIDAFAVDASRWDARLGWSTGLKNGWTRRWTAGLRYDDRSFSATPDQTGTQTTPADRKFAYPWIGTEWIEDAYQKVYNHDRIGRTEDIYQGTRWSASLGYASQALGSTDSALLAEGKFSSGREYRPGMHWEFDASATGRLQAGSLRDAVLRSEARHYWKIDRHQTFFARLKGALTEQLDPDNQLLLGAEEGLRGYPLRYQTGTASALVTLEHRVYTDWYPFRLFHVGAAVFLDAGRTWGPTAGGQPSAGWLKDVGLGLRFGNSRSGLGSVVHVDLSYALDSVPGRDRFQITVETKQGF